jgi:hypothetical protein
VNSISDPSAESQGLCASGTINAIVDSLSSLGNGVHIVITGVALVWRWLGRLIALSSIPRASAFEGRNAVYLVLLMSAL